jgi:hypothetical protein
MKTRIVPILFFFLALLAVGTSFAQKVNVDWERGTDFSQFKTYAWQPSPDPASGLWDQRVIDSVNQQLQAKGFKLVTSNPQLWVVYTAHIKKQQQVVGTGYNMGPTWGWGYWGGPTTTTYNTYTYKEGTLVVEIADNNGRTLLWRGTATDTVQSNPDKGIKTLNNAMKKMFKNFPPKPDSK